MPNLGTIEVEFDKVIHTNSHKMAIGNPRTSLISLLKQYANDYNITILTFRGERQLLDVERWCIANDVPFDNIFSAPATTVAYIGRRAINDKTLFALHKTIKEARKV